jgi:hypothetical protein
MVAHDPKGLRQPLAETPAAERGARLRRQSPQGVISSTGSCVVSRLAYPTAFVEPPETRKL